MMLPSHLLATLLACAIVGLVRPLDRRTWALAVLFGVAIDLDHLLKMPAYAAAHGGFAAFSDPVQMARWGANWQGFMHTPWALALVLPAALGLRRWSPALAWLGHMGLDFVVARHLVRFGGPLEIAIDAALLAALGAIALHDWRRHGPQASFHGHVLARAALVVPRR